MIGLHTYGVEIEFPNSIVYYLCGFAVPCFFMASGYFLLNRGKVDAKYSIRKIVRLTKVVISWNLIYALLKLMLTILKKKMALQGEWWVKNLHNPSIYPD